ncbi:actin protein 4 [Pelomyxa schiedti]|nr:actin protein 4 [Pelomyxa schiedti]
MEHLAKHAITCCASEGNDDEDDETNTTSISQNDQTSQSPSGILICEPPFNSRACRERLTQLAFESLDAQTFRISTTTLLSLFASGRLDGTVVEVGHGASHVVPIRDSVPIVHASMKGDVAGLQLNEYMLSLVTECGHLFLRERVEDIKEKVANVMWVNYN